MQNIKIHIKSHHKQKLHRNIASIMARILYVNTGSSERTAGSEKAYGRLLTSQRMWHLLLRISESFHSSHQDFFDPLCFKAFFLFELIIKTVPPLILFSEIKPNFGRLLIHAWPATGFTLKHSHIAFKIKHCTTFTSEKRVSTYFKKQFHKRSWHFFLFSLN